MMQVGTDVNNFYNKKNTAYLAIDSDTLKGWVTACRKDGVVVYKCIFLI